MTLSAAEVFRDYETDGVPASGPHQVRKVDVREWGAFIESMLNSRMAKTSDYTVADTDNGYTLALGGSALYTLTVPAASGFDANFQIRVLNEDTVRGKKIAINGITNFILWPGQSFVLFNQNNVWWRSPIPRYKPASAFTVFQDTTLGNDSNDGQATGSGGAVATINKAAALIWEDLDCNSFLPTIAPIAGSTVTESLSLTSRGQLTGASTVFIAGNGGSFTWKPLSGFCLQYGDNSIVILRNCRFDGTSTTGNIAISGHQTGVCDINDGMDFGPFPAGYHIQIDTDSKVNFNNDYTISGGGAYHVSGGGGMQVVFNLTNMVVTVSNTPAFTALYRIFGAGAGITEVAGKTWAGSFASGMQKYNIEGPSGIYQAGLTIPGSVAGATGGGGVAY